MTISYSPGPVDLPETVQQRCDLAEIDFEGTGMRASAIPHRHKKVEEVLAKTRALFREALDIPKTHTVLLLEGGATTHFTTLPQQVWTRDIGRKPHIGYVDGGYWSGKALAAGRKLSPICRESPLASSRAQKYTTIPSIRAAYDDAANSGIDFFFFNANETTNGTQVSDDEMAAFGGDWPYPIADMTSELLSRPINVSAFGAIIASAQKNFGKQGLTAIIIREDLIAPCPHYLPPTCDYALSHGKLGGPLNTFNVPTLFSIYAMLEWIRDMGGVVEMERRSRIRAPLLYDAIDRSDLFEGIADPAHRSLMNVTFRLKDMALYERFVQALETAHIASFNGHREHNDLYGQHFRISLYNGMPIENVQYLVDVMKEFERRS